MIAVGFEIHFSYIMKSITCSNEKHNVRLSKPKIINIKTYAHVKELILLILKKQGI